MRRAYVLSKDLLEDSVWHHHHPPSFMFWKKTSSTKSFQFLFCFSFTDTSQECSYLIHQDFFVFLLCSSALHCCCCSVTSVVSDSVRPHRWQHTRLRRPWDSPGKNTGVGCHFLLQCMKVKVKSLSRVQLSVTPWTAAYQALPSIGVSRQEYWSGVPLPSPCFSPAYGKCFGIVIPVILPLLSTCWNCSAANRDSKLVDYIYPLSV